MKSYRRLLPPLDYLLFFEAVARHGSFTRAGEELNVSQAAVSKRIKVLEEWLGISLIARHGRRIALTGDGQKLAATTAEALDYLNAGLWRIRQAGASERFSLAANVAVSQFWLTPRVNEFQLGPQAVPVTLTASDKDADIFGVDADAVFYYGGDIPSGWDGVVLFEEVWLPVAAPAFVHAVQRPEAGTLLDFEKLTPKWINWQDFAGLTGRPDLSASPRVLLASYGSTLDAALRGKGFALGSPDVLQDEIAAGRLVALDDYRLVTGRSYFALWRSGTMTPPLRDFLARLGIAV